MSKVLVFGATGYIGSHLIPRLCEAGHGVRAAARSLEVLEGRHWAGVEVVAADARDAGSVKAALHGVDVAFYLIHSRGPGNDFHLLHEEAAETFRRAAERAGLERLVLLGILPPSAPESAFHAASRSIGERLAAGPIPVTELRVGAILGAGSVEPMVPCFRWMRSRLQPIALRDLIEYLVRLLQVPETLGRRFDVAGPETTSLEGLVRQFAERVGRSPKMVCLPISCPGLSARWLDLAAQVPVTVGRPLIDGIADDLLVDASELRRLIALDLLTCAEAMDEALADERSMPVPARWVEGALPFRNYRPDVSYYGKKVGAEKITDTPVERLWEQIASIGGANGWYYLNFLWWLRGVMDRMLGGVGMRRGRRHPVDIRVGDAIDFYRVIAVNPNRNLTLGVEMKLPGSGVMELSLAGLGDGRTRVSSAAYFHPSGISGHLYWTLLLPIHSLIFKGLVRAIIRRARSGLP